MKRFLAILLLCWSWSAWTQPFLRNTFDTNQNLGFLITGTNFSVPGNISANGATYTNGVTILNDVLFVQSTAEFRMTGGEATGRFIVSDAAGVLNYTPGLTLLGGNTGTNLSLAGNLRANGGEFTNTLTLNGSPVSTNAGSIGPGTVNTLAKFTGANTIGDSSITDDGAGAVAIGDTNNTAFLFLPDELQLGFGSGGNDQLIRLPDGSEATLTIQGSFDPGGNGSGEIVIKTREDAFSDTGNLTLKTGQSDGSDSGEILLKTGNSVNQSGAIRFITGNADSDAGDVEFIGGTSTNATGAEIIFTAGNGDTGGGINFSAGSGSGSDGGSVSFAAGAGAPNGNVALFSAAGNAVLDGTSGRLRLTGGLTLSGQTGFPYTDDGTQLLRNGVAIGGGTTISQNGTNGSPAVNFTNSATVTWARSGSNWTATASSGSAVSANGTNVSPANLTNTASVIYAVSGSNILATVAVPNGTATSLAGVSSAGALAGVGIGTGLAMSGTNLTATSTLVETVTTLTYSGTNVASSAFDCSTNGMSYFLLLTNHVLFGSSSFANLPTKSHYRTFTLCLQQDGTGTWVPKFTNSICNFSEGVQPVITTNANAVSYVYFHTGLATNSTLVGSVNLNIK